MNADDIVVGAGCTAVFAATQNTVITMWSMEEASWEYDITAHLDLPDGGKIVLHIPKKALPDMLFQFAKTNRFKNSFISFGLANYQ